jgi:hypothetical protein
MSFLPHLSSRFGRVLVISLLLAVATIATAKPEIPAITGFSGETIPGIVTEMSLKWGFTGPAPEGMTFRLERLQPDGQAVSLSTMETSARSYKTDTDPGQMSIPYRLTALVGDSIISVAETKALVVHVSGIVQVEARDTPYDGGRQIDVSWKFPALTGQVQGISIYRTAKDEGKWTLAGSADSAAASFTDMGLEDGILYGYMVRVHTTDAAYDSRPVMNVTSHAAWFDMRKINLLVIAVFVLAAVIWYVLRTGKKEIYIRRIAGLQAVEEAVGRATEMGRSVLFIPGIQDLDDVQTIAGLTILGAVAKLTAQYETRLDVPVARSLVMSNGREVVKESYLSVGRPDFYHDEIVHYVTDEQFGYVAAVDGIMVREKPAACFYMGGFFAESLILAETGNHVGAIQIAGTAMPTQLPFFVAACDYTLIGEELFAASAYLSKDRRSIASLRGQDVGKLLAMGAIVFGAAITTVVSLAGGGGFWSRLAEGFLRLFALNY